jgi:hypothetical protein
LGVKLYRSLILFFGGYIWVTGEEPECGGQNPLKFPRATGCLLLKKRSCLISELSEYQQKKVSGFVEWAVAE